jgi:hypothetical protein
MPASHPQEAMGRAPVATPCNGLRDEGVRMLRWETLAFLKLPANLPPRILDRVHIGIGIPGAN